PPGGVPSVSRALSRSRRGRLDLRRRVQLQLNRGEHRHSLARWIFFADQGGISHRRLPGVMNKASCLSLVSNAILIWNTLQMARIVETLRQAGTPRGR